MLIKMEHGVYYSAHRDNGKEMKTTILTPNTAAPRMLKMPHESPYTVGNLLNTRGQVVVNISMNGLLLLFGIETTLPSPLCTRALGLEAPDEVRPVEKEDLPALKPQQSFAKKAAQVEIHIPKHH